PLRAMAAPTARAPARALVTTVPLSGTAITVAPTPATSPAAAPQRLRRSQRAVSAGRAGDAMSADLRGNGGGGPGDGLAAICAQSTSRSNGRASSLGRAPEVLKSAVPEWDSISHQGQRGSAP